MEEVVAVTHVAPVILRSWVARASFSLDDLDELFCGVFGEIVVNNFSSLIRQQVTYHDDCLYACGL